MLERNELLSLMKATANASRNTQVAYSYGDKNYSYTELNETLRDELNAYAGSYSLYRENKNLIFSLMEETLTEVLPKMVIDRYGDFAEVKTFAQGDKPIFKKKTGRARAKHNFITRVGLAGIYEVFKLGEKAIEVTTDAVGGAAQIGLEEFLDGRVDFAELTEIVMEGLDEEIYRQIGEALIAGIGALPAANIAVNAGWDEGMFDNLIAIAGAYGQPTIYCTFEFASRIFSSSTQQWSERMKDERWQNGYFTNYKGNKVIVLPQSFTDETNTTKVFNPKYCFIIPNGVDGKPVKVAFEGDTIVDEFVNYDRSREIQVYKKLGVAAIMSNGICTFVNTSL